MIIRNKKTGQKFEVMEGTNIAENLYEVVGKETGDKNKDPKYTIKTTKTGAVQYRKDGKIVSKDDVPADVLENLENSEE